MKKKAVLQEALQEATPSMPFQGFGRHLWVGSSVSTRFPMRMRCASLAGHWFDGMSACGRFHTVPRATKQLRACVAWPLNQSKFFQGMNAVQSLLVLRALLGIKAQKLERNRKIDLYIELDVI